MRLVESVFHLPLSNECNSKELQVNNYFPVVHKCVQTKDSFLRSGSRGWSETRCRSSGHFDQLVFCLRLVLSSPCGTAQPHGPIPNRRPSESLRVAGLVHETP